MWAAATIFLAGTGASCKLASTEERASILVGYFMSETCPHCKGRREEIGCRLCPKDAKKKCWECWGKCASIFYECKRMKKRWARRS